MRPPRYVVNTLSTRLAFVTPMISICPRYNGYLDIAYDREESIGNHIFYKLTMLNCFTPLKVLRLLDFLAYAYTLSHDFGTKARYWLLARDYQTRSFT